MKIPVCLVTGFLGAGKTSLLKHIAVTCKSRRLVFLVNEFSPCDIDGALVSAESDSVIAIPGGSIFCKCLVTEFIGKLKTLPEKYPDVEGVVIEASGMANPKVVQTMLNETGMSKVYELARIVSIVDPNSYLKLIHTLPNIIAQVEAADIVLVNKADAVSPDLVDRTIKAVLAVNPGVETDVCSFGKYDLELFPGRDGWVMEGEYAKCRDPNFNTETVDLSVESMDELENWLRKSDAVYRAKGSVKIGGVRRGVEFSASGLVLSPELDGTETLVVIRKGSAGTVKA